MASAFGRRRPWRSTRAWGARERSGAHPHRGFCRGNVRVVLRRPHLRGASLGLRAEHRRGGSGSGELVHALIPTRPRPSGRSAWKAVAWAWAPARWRASSSGLGEAVPPSCGAAAVARASECCCTGRLSYGSSSRSSAPARGSPSAWSGRLMRRARWAEDAYPRAVALLVAFAGLRHRRLPRSARCVPRRARVEEPQGAARDSPGWPRRRLLYFVIAAKLAWKLRRRPGRYLLRPWGPPAYVALGMLAAWVVAFAWAREGRTPDRARPAPRPRRPTSSSWWWTPSAPITCRTTATPPAATPNLDGLRRRRHPLRPGLRQRVLDPAELRVDAHGPVPGEPRRDVQGERPAGRSDDASRGLKGAGYARRGS
jgi:hypothetical protein